MNFRGKMVRSNKKFILDDSIGYLINRTGLHIKHVLLHTLRVNGLDVTPEQFAILMRLWHSGGLYQRQIADSLLKDKPNITRILDVLEKRQLVKRISDENDRRKFKIFLTEEGEKLVDKMFPIMDEIQAKVQSNLTDGEAETLKMILNKIYKQIEIY
jgi:DNA-binding MarR family transcriptional regulator